MYLVGAGGYARDIAAVVGGSEKSSWIGSSVPVIAVVLSSPVSQASDLWGRKWFLVGLTTAGSVGCIVTSRATSMNMAIAGAVIAGLSFGAQCLVIAIPSEVLPRRLRPIVQSCSTIAGTLGGVFGFLVGGALTRYKNVEGFRTYWYIVAGMYFASAIGCALLYNPPPRELQRTLTRREKLRTLDWTGYALLSSGLILFCMALIWSQNPYQWTNAHVLATFLIGLALSAGLIIYESKFKKDGMFHHELFSHSRNFALSLGCIAVEGLVFFTGTYYYPFQVSVLYEPDSFLGSLRLSMCFLVGCVVLAVTGWYCAKNKSVRIPLLCSYVGFTIFNVLMATTTLGSNAAVWGYAVLLGSSIGLCLSPLISVAQFATPPSMIAMATGLLVALRNLGGAVALAIYKAIFSGTLARGVAHKVPKAVLASGLPPSSVKPFIAALMAHDAAALSEIPGISKPIIAAGSHALLEAYSVAFRYVWVAAACFSVVGGISKLNLTFSILPRESSCTDRVCPL